MGNRKQQKLQRMYHLMQEVKEMLDQVDPGKTDKMDILSATINVTISVLSDTLVLNGILIPPE